MGKTRKIIEIDEEKCNGCGQCILSCAEGALELVDGKAKLVGEIYCDGLGACIGDCPEDALTIIEREADDFDEEAVDALLKTQKQSPAAAEAPQKEAPMACGCPATQTMTLKKTEGAAGDEPAGPLHSQLGHWPIKLQLLGPNAPFLKGADLLLMADCTAVAFPDLHRKLLSGRAVALGCPKLDDLDAHVQRLSEILAGAGPRSLTVVYMEVPCCHGFMFGAQKAIEMSGVDLPLHQMMIGRSGEILRHEEIPRAKVNQTAGAEK